MLIALVSHIGMLSMEFVRQGRLTHRVGVEDIVENERVPLHDAIVDCIEPAGCTADMQHVQILVLTHFEPVLDTATNTNPLVTISQLTYSEPLM